MVLRTGYQPVIAALDKGQNSVSLYHSLEFGTWELLEQLPTGFLPVRIEAADINWDGLTDFAVANAGSNSVTIFFADEASSSFTTQEVGVGFGPSDIRIDNVNRRGGLDIVVSNQVSGDVSVLFAPEPGEEWQEQRYRAGEGQYSTTETAQEELALLSVQGTAGTTVADLNKDGHQDIVVTNKQANTVGILFGKGKGGFVNPVVLQAGFDPESSQVADLNGDEHPDLVVLNTNSDDFTIFLNNGQGEFIRQVTLDEEGEEVPLLAGNAPTGFSIRDINRDRKRDLVVGNEFGDVLILLGNGDGTFRSYVRTDQRVPFVATHLNHDGVIDVVLANQAHDLALSQIRDPETDTFVPGGFHRDGSDGLIGPGDVVEADLDKRHGTDLVFANSGSNNVLVYLRQADGSFADTPLSFFAGTNPVDLHVAQFTDDNGDGVVNALDYLDMSIVNQGSYDITVLHGTIAVGSWTFETGPRLQTGGLGANSVTSQDTDGDNIPDLLVANGEEGTLGTLPGIGTEGVGTGFFDDTNIVTTHISPDLAPVVQTELFNNGLFTVSQQDTISRLDLGTGQLTSAFNPSVGREVNFLQ